ncbi:terminase TerL endonuclease subunit [uncultured Jannaschia sp.]|uniref:terminase large subunit n=1 Tax=uncultured Jannaschia sp. TaxID=293347 RepID=UPI002637763D|nr:terminase TerL endonuclease subunit [uncultured Jannaschia sp.]
MSFVPRDWATACPDWEERIVEGRSLIPDLPLFDPVADKALRIFKRLRVPDLVGTPTYGEVCENWVFDFVRAIFGSYDPETKRRMIREFFLMIPKKNGKSAIAAAIILVAAILNERPEVELILIAETHTIAGISFRQMEGMIKLDPGLTAIFHVRSHLKVILHRTTGAMIRILSADGDVVTGSKAAYILVDEAHVLGHKTKAADLYVELTGGLASRPEGFFLEITTQSKIEPHGEFKRRLQRARAVRDGKLDLPILAVIYEMPREKQKSEAWRDPATWGIVNPNLERSVSLDYLRDEMTKAEIDGADKLALFASQHLNVEIGLGLHSERWVAADYWAAQTSDGLGLAELMARSEVCVVGGDLGGADDLSSLCVMGRCRETRHRLVWAKAWVHPGVLKKRQEIAPKLLDLEAAGDLVIDADIDVHVEQMVDICMALEAAALLPEGNAVGLDAYGVAALLDALELRGMPLEKFGAVGQGFKLNGAIKGLERRLLNGTLEHGGQPIMTWCLGNAKAEARGNNVLITKARAGVAKIDLLIAMFNAAILMDMNPEAAGGPSVYEERGLLTV